MVESRVVFLNLQSANFSHSLTPTHVTNSENLSIEHLCILKGFHMGADFAIMLQSYEASFVIYVTYSHWTTFFFSNYNFLRILKFTVCSNVLYLSLT